MNPFSKKDWIRSAHQASEGHGSLLWPILGALLFLVLLASFLQNP